MNIGNFEIGTRKTFIIAECCSNIIPHLYNLENIVKQVASTGADAVKVQLYLADNFPVSERASKKRTEFPRDVFPEFVKLCHERGLACGASVFNEEAISIVIGSGGDFLKLATREWQHQSLYDLCDETGKPVIYSYDFRKDVGYRGKIISHGLAMVCDPQYPSNSAPSALEMTAYGKRGWSSHTNHWLDVIVAVSHGAIIVEKHIKFTADDYEAGWSLYPEQFQQMVKDIRWVEETR